MQRDDGEGAQHDELTLGEIDDGRGIEDYAETQGDEGIDGPIGEAGEEILQNFRNFVQGIAEIMGVGITPELLRKGCGEMRGSG
jgi:hypothetical protein